MSNIALFQVSCRSSHRLLKSTLIFPPLRTSRSVSLNSAVARGLRRSKGVGFRGKERYQDGGSSFGENSESSRDGPVRRTADSLFLAEKPQMSRDGWRDLAGKGQTSSIGSPSLRVLRGKKDVSEKEYAPPRRSRAARYNDPDSGFGKRSSERKGIKRTEADAEALVQDLSGPSAFRKTEVSNSYATNGGRRQSSFSGHESNPDWNKETTRSKSFRPEQNRPASFRSRPALSDSSRRAAESDKVAAQRNPNGTKLSASRLAYLERISHRPARKETEPQTGVVPNFSRELQNGKSTMRNQSSGTPEAASSARPVFTQTMGNRLPLSIPYTTPASEFLYGTSVVEAALRSHRTPRRKLYKLYVYTGENRDNLDRDAGIERLAKKIGIDIVRVDAGGVRLLDKMSGGRPHNGYILEASPLPKLPVTSLGSLTSKDGQIGFEVLVDHQSREEAAVNGTSNFIPVLRDAQGRKPFVILLDSILDPGNLGGIIRTASFLGVTAIGISTRNSASFTPVVLKASAGASENVTLFSIAKPSGFVAESKLAGWKIYAAVAPSGKRDSSMPPSITTDDLGDPLERDPCILMLGNEGEGLRWNLRSKADIELAIQGSNQKSGVDSLNVSVATGILCSSFLRRNVGEIARSSQKGVEESTKLRRDLF